MNEWCDSQKRQGSDFRKRLQKRNDKANTRRLELTKEEKQKLKNLSGIFDTLIRGENVQNRQLRTWLSEEEYAQMKVEWQEQLELRKELEDKPSELKRYEEKLKQATFYFNRAEG